jgi:hypothetical protein
LLHRRPSGITDAAGAVAIDHLAVVSRLRSWLGSPMEEKKVWHH